MKRIILAFICAAAVLAGGCVTDNGKFPTPDASFTPKNLFESDPRGLVTFSENGCVRLPKCCCIEDVHPRILVILGTTPARQEETERFRKPLSEDLRTPVFGPTFIRREHVPELFH